LREAIVGGQPTTHRPWNKILIVVEGIYSMEGEILRLPEIIALKKKYKAYLYVDEAHSIGSLGKHGAGVCDYWGVDPADVDVLMGTFTKAFGSVGGYIAASYDLIAYLRTCSFGQIYETSLAPPCVQQVISALDVVTGRDGTKQGEERIKRLRDNSNYFRKRLSDLGFSVFGDTDSAVIPVMLHHLSKMPVFSRACLDENIAVVVVGYPATPFLLCRVRFCISASHTREDLDWALDRMSEIGDTLLLKYHLVDAPTPAPNPNAYT